MGTNTKLIMEVHVIYSICRASGAFPSRQSVRGIQATATTPGFPLHLPAGWALPLKGHNKNANVQRE